MQVKLKYKRMPRNQILSEGGFMLREYMSGTLNNLMFAQFSIGIWKEKQK